MGWRLNDAPRHRASLFTLLVAFLTAAVVLAILLYPPLVPTAPPRDSPRVQAASFTVTTPARPGVDQRGLATTVGPEPDGGLALREWTASAPVEIVPSGGTAVNLPAGLRVTAVAVTEGDRGSEVDGDGLVRVSVTAADAERLGLAEGETFAVTGASGTLRLRLSGGGVDPAGRRSTASPCVER